MRPLPAPAAAERLNRDNGAEGSAQPQVRHELKGLGGLFLTPHILAKNKFVTHRADPYRGAGRDFWEFSPPGSSARAAGAPSAGKVSEGPAPARPASITPGRVRTAPVK